MPDELTELLDTAMYREIVSQAIYEAGQKKTRNPAAIALMKELAEEEVKHAELIREFKEKQTDKHIYHSEMVPDLMISEYITGSDDLEGSGLQDTLAFAIKREQQAIEFYSKMTRVLRYDIAKRLCERLVHEELKHKLKLETFYDDLFYKEE